MKKTAKKATIKLKSGKKMKALNMPKTGDPLAEDTLKSLKKLFKKPNKDNVYLKKRIDIRDDCFNKKNEKQRVIYGTCRCDSFSMNYTLLRVIANYIYQYMADAKDAIIREDWDIMEKHADAIAAYAEADSWDELCEGDEKEKRFEYYQKEKAFREAMFWLTENIKGLWW